MWLVDNRLSLISSTQRQAAFFHSKKAFLSPLEGICMRDGRHLHEWRTLKGRFACVKYAVGIVRIVRKVTRWASDEGSKKHFLTWNVRKTENGATRHEERSNEGRRTAFRGPEKGSSPMMAYGGVELLKFVILTILTIPTIKNACRRESVKLLK